jgi:alpha-D-xyloside xylohydrolase
MDFPNDSHVADLRDEYMFGPAFLVAPITDQGATSRNVYLPEGADWYNYWTNERIKGGQTIVVNAPIDTLPLFVRAGSIVPIGMPIESTMQAQAIARVKVYPGANASFNLYDDDGSTYAYEKGVNNITRLQWDDAATKMSYAGAPVWTQAHPEAVEIIGH